MSGNQSEESSSFTAPEPVPNAVEIEKMEEEKLKAKYAIGGSGPGLGRPGGHSAFLQKRLLQKGKGQKYFDSGDYQMAKQKGGGTKSLFANKPIAELKDTIRIPPEIFHMKLIDAVKDEINRKLANKVLLNVGLCIALKDIIRVSDSIILPGDGASHTEILFRYIVFRPRAGDIITGRIRSCSREGVHVTLGFFDDILIPPTALQHPSRFEEAEQAWVWEYPLEEGATHDLYMDIGEPIKFRVSGDIFEESSPIGPPSNDKPSTSSQSDIKTPYRIVAAINESGLGLLSWWDQQNQQMNEGDDAGEEYEE